MVVESLWRCVMQDDKRFERVHMMTDYYDGPLCGIADYCGRPRLYEAVFNETVDAYEDVFHLSPVDDDLFTLAMEAWQIWLRWESAFYEGQTTLDTHPALNADRARHEELYAILQERLVIDDGNHLRAHGEFRYRDGATWLGRALRPHEVRWSPLVEAQPRGR